VDNDVDLFVFDVQTGEVIEFSNGVVDNERVMIDVAGGNSYLIQVHGFFGSVHRDYDLVIDGPDASAADFNLDGRVDGNDMLILQTGVGIISGATRANGDADGDGDVDFDDFQIWQAEYNAPPPAATALSTGTAAPAAGTQISNKRPPNMSALAVAGQPLDGFPPPTSATLATDDSTRLLSVRGAARLSPNRRSDFRSDFGQTQQSVAARLAVLAVDRIGADSAQQTFNRERLASRLGSLVRDDLRFIREENELASSVADVTNKANAIDRYFEQLEDADRWRKHIGSDAVKTRHPRRD
jgi:hypothetical protein